MLSALALAACGSFEAAAQRNLVTNPGFEDGIWGPVGRLEGAVWDPGGYQGGYALRFDGGAATFVVAAGELLIGPSGVAAEVRVKTTELLHNHNTVIGQFKDPGSQQNSWVMYLDEAGKPHFTVFAADNTSDSVAGEASVADGEWHLIGVRYDGHTMQLQVDDQVVGAKQTATSMQTPRYPVRVGRGAAFSEDHAGRFGGLNGLVDDVRIYDRASDVPDRPAASFDLNEGRGESVRSLGGTSAQKLLGDRRISLIQDGRPDITIVYGKQDAEAAARLRALLAAALGVQLPIAEDAQVLAPGAWRLGEAWTERNLLLLGNVNSNRAILPLYGQVLAGASARYPGPGRYVLRTIFAPVRRNAHTILLGASDDAGLEAGINRFARLARALAQSHGGSMPPLIELGSAAGPDTPPAAGSGDFYDVAGRFYWHGSLGAGLKAREMLLADMQARERGLWGFRESGHYQWEGNYRGLRQLIAGGALSDEELRRVDERLLENALENEDGYGVSVVSRDSESVNRSLGRHLVSAVTGQFVIFEYLDNIGSVPADKRDEVREKHELLRGHIESFIRRGRYRGNHMGREGLDIVTALSGLYLHAGDERLVANNAFRNMADFFVANVDNLGYQAGQDSYITCRPGCHYGGTSGGLGLLAAGYFHRDGQYRWLAENMSGFGYGSAFRVRFPPEMLSLPDEVPAADPDRYVGVFIVPMDPWAYELLKGQTQPEAVLPIEASYDQVFSTAVFRDGFAPEDAYLMLQGINLGAQNRNEGYQGNAIVRYTELGSLLLFHNTMRHTSWARNVVSTSRGQHDPQAAACVLDGRFRGPVVSGVRSLFPHDGGAAWHRSIIRRHGGYFLVLDEMTAEADDTYRFICRWRSFHPGETDGAREFSATDGMNGTRLHIVASEPVSQTARLEPRDGAARPTILRQAKSARLAAGERVSFQNLVYATNDAVGRHFDVRRLSDAAAMVKGRCNEFEEVAAAGTGRLRPPEVVSGGARLWYLSSNGLAVVGTRSLAIRDHVRVEADAEFSLQLLRGGAAGVIENPAEVPIDVNISCQADGLLAVDSQPLAREQRLRLEPGEHALMLRQSDRLFAEATARLDVMWEAASVSAEPGAETAEEAASDPWQEAWRSEGIRPALRKHWTVKASAEPETTTGTPAAWVDRRIHYSAPSAGWEVGVEGAAVLDLYKPVEVNSLRVVGSMGQFSEGEMSFRVVLSNDGLADDVRQVDVPQPRFETHYAEMAHYMYTYQFPAYVLPVGGRARHVKIIGRGREREEAVRFHEIEVVTEAREDHADTSLFVEDFGGRDRRALLAASGDRVVMLSREGEHLWEHSLESPLVNVSVADVNSDGKQEIVVFTLAEKLHVYNEDGSPRFVHDARGGQAGGYTPLRPGAIGARRPDDRGRLEYFFLPHVRYVRVSPEPELKQSDFRAQGGKHALTVPDVTGDGRDELAIVGLYGGAFGVVDSGSDLAAGELRYVSTHGLTGYNSGNMELPVYFDASVARTQDAEARWLGLVALNPGGINFFSAPDFEPVWNHFNHAPNTCHCLHDLTGDGIPELLVGREDGFVTEYTLTDGAVVNRAFVGAEVRAIAAGGADIVVGTREGLVLLDRRLRTVAVRPGGVQSLGVLETSPTGIELLAVAYEDGAIAALSLPLAH